MVRLTATTKGLSGLSEADTRPYRVGALFQLNPIDVGASHSRGVAKAIWRVRLTGSSNTNAHLSKMGSVSCAGVAYATASVSRSIDADSAQTPADVGLGAAVHE